MSEQKRRRTLREHVYDNAMIAMRPLTSIVRCHKNKRRDGRPDDDTSD